MALVDVVDDVVGDADEGRSSRCFATPQEFANLCSSFIRFFRPFCKMPALTWTDPVVTEPVDASQVARAPAEISKSTQDVLDSTRQNLRVITVQRPSTSQVISYLDSLDVGFDPEADSSSPRVSTQDILRHANVNATQNLSGGSIETRPPFAKHSGANTPSSSSLPSTASAPAVDTSVPLPSTCAAAPGSAGSSASVAVVSSPEDDIGVGASSGAGSSGVVTVAGEAVIAAGPSTSAAAESATGLGAP
ncbi:hypothetical protein BT96DRAFT_1009948, partial [Gymnopus androsaceus JB14]